MLDTIKVKYTLSPTPEQLTHWTRQTSQSEGKGEREKYVYNPTLDNGGVTIRYTYHPLAYNEEPLLTLEFSLPKLVLGNNFQMIGDIEEAIQTANRKLESVPHAPQVDIGEGILLRLDLCYNHPVGDMVDDFIQAIGKLEYPHRRTKHHRNEGAEFRAKHKTTKFYNKERETGTPDAYGILRQEATILKAKNIQKMLGVKKPTLRHITPLFVKEQLEAELEKLNLAGNIIATRDTAAAILCEQHGHYTGMYLYAMIDKRQDNSKKQIAAQTKAHPRSIERQIKKVVDAGIAPTFTERDTPLPPLSIRFH